MQPVIIYPRTIDWDILHQRPQQLLKALAGLGCICIFCNPNLSKRYPGEFIYVNDNLVLANNKDLNTVIEWARTNYRHQPISVYFTYPPQIKQILSMKVDLIIFDSVDEPSCEFANWLSSYNEAVRAADIVAATSQSLLERVNKIRKDDVLFLPNACDYEHFSTAQTKQFIDCEPFNGSKPVAGYFGAIAPWVDIKLINWMAHCLTDFEFVIIGPLLCQKWVAFTSPNIRYLGSKEYCELPKYLSNFSYCLIPFKLTAMTRGVNPVKFWEYLASGIPILSTALPEVPPAYATTICEEMFPGYIPSADNQGRTARIALARNNSWTVRAGKLLQAIQSKLQFG